MMELRRHHLQVLLQQAQKEPLAMQSRSFLPPLVLPVELLELNPALNLPAMCRHLRCLQMQWKDPLIALLLLLQCRWAAAAAMSVMSCLPILGRLLRLLLLLFLLLDPTSAVVVPRRCRLVFQRLVETMVTACRQAMSALWMRLVLKLMSMSALLLIATAVAAMQTVAALVAAVG
jgi:hypothetical protein